MKIFRIGIDSDHIHKCIARVPRRIVPGCKDPDQVMDIVYIHQAVIQKSPEPDEGFWALRAPPEPTTLGLVERPPQHRNSLCIQPLKLYGHQVNILHERCPLG
jgi:hypothetical protein